MDTDEYVVARDHGRGRNPTSRHPSKPDTGIHEPTPHPSTTNERQAARADHNNHDQHDHQGSRGDGPTAALATTAVTAPVVGTAVVGTAVVGTAVVGTAVVGTAVVGTAVVGTATATDSRAVGKSATLLSGIGEERLAGGNLPGQLVHFAAALYTDADTVRACAAFWQTSPGGLSVPDPATGTVREAGALVSIEYIVQPLIRSKRLIRSRRCHKPVSL
ncbi:hypothetical protein ACTXG6_34205 [Pseudonocardia sp. Cha107L01]|uniref:hypothetical protein n=1 Tax=Pseudonocardia sp. Cha107L01 TaxID=3457576 RepID=UPI00403E4A95